MGSADESVNPVDLILVALFAACALRGYVRGVFREVMGLAGLVLGALAVIGLWRPAAAEPHRVFDLELRAAVVVAAVLIFVAVNVLTRVAALALDRVARAVLMTGMARISGAIVCVAKGAVIFGLLLFFVRSLVPDPGVTGAIDDSTLGAPLAKAAGRLFRAGANMLTSAEPHEA